MNDMEPVVFVTGPLAVNTLVLPLDSGRCAVVDPGGAPSTIIAYLSREGLEPGAIVLTHGHWDHIAALSELAAAWPDAEIAIHGEDASWLGNGALARHRSFFGSLGAGDLVDPSAGELPAPTLLLSEGEDFRGWRVLHTPGHTPGSISLWRESEGLLVSGDTLFRSGYGRTDGPGGSDASLAASLRRLLALPAETRVYPGHGEPTTIGEERRGYSL